MTDLRRLCRRVDEGQPRSTSSGVMQACLLLNYPWAAQP